MLKSSERKGFSIMELILVLAIIMLISWIILVSVNTFKNKSYYARSLEEFKTLAAALELYRAVNAQYPPDVSRDLPPGLEAYISGGGSATWPKAPWPGSVYDWDNWPDPGGGKDIRQISIRF